VKLVWLVAVLAVRGRLA
jgi:hypothetical protein